MPRLVPTDGAVDADAVATDGPSVGVVRLWVEGTAIVESGRLVCAGEPGGAQRADCGDDGDTGAEVTEHLPEQVRPELVRPEPVRPELVRGGQGRQSYAPRG